MLTAKNDGMSSWYHLGGKVAMKKLLPLPELSSTFRCIKLKVTDMKNDAVSTYLSCHY